MAPPKGYKQTPEHKAAVRAAKIAKRAAAGGVSPDVSERRREGARKGAIARWAKHRAEKGTATTRTTVARVPRSPEPATTHDQTPEQVQLAFLCGKITTIIEAHCLRTGASFGAVTGELGRFLHNAARGALVGAGR